MSPNSAKCAVRGQRYPMRGLAYTAKCKSVNTVFKEEQYMKKRFFALLLAAAILALAACNGVDSPVDTAKDTAEAEPASEDGNKLVPDIPKDLRFDGKTFRVFSSPYAYFGPVLEDYELESNATVLSEALYYRLVRTEEKFGITMELNYGVEGQITEPARAAIAAGSDDFDLLVDPGFNLRNLAYEGYFIPVSELPYVDIEKPWWNKNFMESVSVNSENPYFLFGPINCDNINRSICTFFNIDMLEVRTGLTEQDLYNVVIDGKWTIDKMTELSKLGYSDENGNTIMDEEDNYGFIHSNHWQVGFAAYSSGLRFTSRDENNLPVLALKNEQSVDLTDKLLQLFSSDNAAYNEKDNHKSVLMFGTGHGLFHINRLCICEWTQIRDNDVKYGIIPPPKYDESIEVYTSAIQETAQWHCVPVTASETDFISAILEYYAYEGYENVVPAYFDVTLKLKYTRGDLDGASYMLDLIVANQYTDFMSINTLGGMENIFRDICRSGQNNFSSRYASLENSAKYYLKTYVSELE